MDLDLDRLRARCLRLPSRVDCGVFSISFNGLSTRPVLCRRLLDYVRNIRG